MNTSFWWESLEPWIKRPSLTSNLDVDVAIVGAGYTGLWSAYWLMKTDPNLKIVILEAEHVGFGASGRNGGWVSALWPAPLDSIVKQRGKQRAFEFQSRLQELIPEIGETLKTENIVADFKLAGTAVFATNQAQLNRLKSENQSYLDLGFNESDYKIDYELANLPLVPDLIAAHTTRHCASINPAKLVTQLAKVVEKQGVQIFETSRVTLIEPNKVFTNTFQVKAKNIIQATEGYSYSLKHNRRKIAPIHSLMFATDQIPESLLTKLRIEPGQTFADARNLVIYGQRTSDNRIAFGGRGAPYRFKSQVGKHVEMHQSAFEYLQLALVGLFPDLKPYVHSGNHKWGGPIGVTRDWRPTVSVDPKSGVCYAGGYAGDGVAASYLAGQTLADLITNTHSVRTTDPWVNHQSPNWEIEPIRFILINFVSKLISFADRKEESANKQSWMMKKLWKILKG